jgi:signal recognition particle GTPase
VKLTEERKRRWRAGGKGDTPPQDGYCTAAAAVVDERALMRDALKRSMGHVSSKEVRSHFEERIAKGDLIEMKAPIGRSFTTPEMMTLERDNIERMRAGQDRYAGLVAQHNTFEHVSKSQRQAVETILESRDQIMGFQGAAGAGKTTSLSALREAAEKEGYTVEGFALTSRAAYQLEEAGIRSSTLQHHLAQGSGVTCIAMTRSIQF